MSKNTHAKFDWNWCKWEKGELGRTCYGITVLPICTQKLSLGLKCQPSVVTVRLRRQSHDSGSCAQGVTVAIPPRLPAAPPTQHTSVLTSHPLGMLAAAHAWRRMAGGGAVGQWWWAVQHKKKKDVASKLGSSMWRQRRLPHDTTYNGPCGPHHMCTVVCATFMWLLRI